MANLNFYHVYKQTIRASSSSSSEGRKESLPAIVAVVDARKTSHNICISISYAVKKIHMLLRLLLGKKRTTFPSSISCGANAIAFFRAAPKLYGKNRKMFTFQFLPMFFHYKFQLVNGDMGYVMDHTWMIF